MSSTCELNNPEQLSKILAELEQTPGCASDLFNRFPFASLANAVSFDSNIITPLVQILNSFVRDFDLPFDQQRLQGVCLFYANHLNEVNINKYSDASMQLLLKGVLLTYTRRSTLGFVKPNLLKSINVILESDAFNRDTKQLVVEFVMYLLSQNDLPEDGECEKCIANIWRLPMIEMNRFEFAKSLICHTSNQAIPSRAEATKLFMDTQESYMPIKTAEMLTDLAYVYENCQDKRFRSELTINLVRKNFALSIDRNHYLSDLIQVFYHQVGVLFENTPWNGDLKREIRQYLTSDPNEYTCEYYLINAYIELVYHKIKHDPKIMIANIMRSYGGNLPTNPPVLKAVCALFPAYLKESQLKSPQIDKFESDLIAAILPNNITLHRAQFSWIFANGKLTLKNKTLQFWLNNYDNDIALAKSINKINEEKCLVKALVLSPEVEGKRRVLRLLSLMPNAKKENISLYVMHLIYKSSNLSLATVEAIMQAKPANCPTPSIHIDKKVMIGRFMQIINNYRIELRLKNTLKLQLYAYLFRMIVNNMNDAANCKFVTVEMVTMVLWEIENPAENLHILMKSMLLRILRLQVRLRVLVVEQVPFTCFITDVTNTEDVLLTVKIFSKLTDMDDGGIIPIISLMDNEVPLALYTVLLNLIDSANAHFVANSLIYMFTHNRCCAETYLNYAAIDVYTEKQSNNPFFLQYLTEWYLYVQDSFTISIPKKQIVDYVLYLNSLGISTELDDLTVVLDD